MKPDYSKYSKEDIDQALSAIDEKKYPDRYKELLNIKQRGIYFIDEKEGKLFEKTKKLKKENFITKNPIKLHYEFSSYIKYLYYFVLIAILIGAIFFGNSREETLGVLIDSFPIDLQYILIITLIISLNFGYKIFNFIQLYLTEYSNLKYKFSKEQKKYAILGLITQLSWLLLLFLTFFGCSTLILYKEYF